MLTMKIWLNTAPNLQFVGDDCSDDCPTDCSRGDFDNGTFLYNSSTRNSVQKMYDCQLQQVAPLYIHPCDHERWLICHPSGNGHIIVVDAEALALLEQFYVPTTIHDVMQNRPGGSGTTVVAAVTLFFQLGLLQDFEQPAS